MATLTDPVYLPLLHDGFGVPHSDAFAALLARSDALPVGEYVGALVKFPYADGYAVYRVTQIGAVDVTLAHVPYGDGWSLPEWQLRGLTADDVRNLVEGERRIAKLFRER